jgi:PAS domain S-box-containing protein
MVKGQTASQQSDDQLLDSENAAKANASIIYFSDDAIIGTTLDGLITSWNPGAEQMYGHSVVVALGRHISLIIPESIREEHNELLERITRGERVEHHGTKGLRSDGAVLDVSITISPMRDATGTIIGSTTVGRNISERVSLASSREVLERRLNHSERLESLGQLAGGIAHDFNNLLAVISSYTEFVSEELEDGQVAAKADVDQIRIAADRARVLVRQLLAFARREVLQPEVVNLNDVVAGLEELLRRTIGAHIELSVNLAEGLSLVEVDPGQLEQVLVNLVVNARDAMPTGGSLTIDTANLDLDEAHNELHPGLEIGPYARLRVSDTGEGMEQLVLDHIFEPFFTTKPRGEGTGLGLPMAFGIVAQAGGEIQVYSEPGVGTTVRILLPATERAPSGTHAVAEVRLLEGTETVLIVEDEDAIREVTRRILVRAGYYVLTCASGVEAIGMVEGYPGQIDLLVTDVIMPQMLGREVATRVQALRPGTPVLFMSGYAQPVLGSTLDEETILLEKPFSAQLLLEKVREVLEKSK